MLAQLPYLQPFEDVNKRVSRLAANIPLIRHHLSPLSFVDVPVIFLTSYDQNHLLNGDKPMANSEILTKPVNFEILSHSIRKLMDE